MKQTKPNASTLDRAIRLLEQKRAVFKIDSSNREAMRIVASIMRIGTRPRRKRRT